MTYLAGYFKKISSKVQLVLNNNLPLPHFSCHKKSQKLRKKGTEKNEIKKNVMKNQ